MYWRSFELRPKGSPPMPPEYRARIEAGRPRLVQMAREQYGLEINQGPFGIDSRPALIAAKYAEAQGVGEAFHAAVFRAYWQQAESIADLDVLARIGAEVGLEREGLLAALDDPRYAAEVDEDIAIAQAHGMTGVPALVFDLKYLVTGAQPLATLRQVVEKVQAEQDE